MKKSLQKISKKSALSFVFTTCFSMLLILTSFSQTLYPGNNTVANSMVISNVTATSATISWQYLEANIDNTPQYNLYSKTSTEQYYQFIQDKLLNFPLTGNSNTIKSDQMTVTGLQPNTTYTWFLSLSDEGSGQISLPFPFGYYNNGILLGILPAANGTYQTITFTTPAIGGSYNGTSVTNTFTTTIPANQLPVANAGADIVLASGVNNTTLSGILSTDADGGIAYYNWAKTAGPASFTQGPNSTVTFDLSNLVQGTYTYRLIVTDSRGAVSQDFVNITVGTTPPVNQAPTANAGSDQTITLPTNTASLSGSGTDTDGTIASYAWSVVSGPNTPTFGNANVATTSLSNLVQGTYTLQLRVTDNLGATATDLVVINVNPAVVVTCTNDNFEPNNTSVAARTISLGTNILAKICPLNDEDFFSFSNSNNARNIRVTLSTLPTNYIVELYAPNGTLAGSRTTAGTANKVIVFNTSTVGTYRVRVLAGTGAVANNSNYTLRVETAKNAFAAARVVNTKVIEKDAINSNDLIVYPNPARGVINVQLPSNEVFRTITLINASGVIVKQLNNQQSSTIINIENLKSGIYYLKAVNSTNQQLLKKIVVVQ